MKESFPCRATLEVQKNIDKQVQSDEKILCLHAKYLSFQHPVTGSRMVFEAPAPF